VQYIATISSTRPRPEDSPTWWSYHQASRAWKRRTGGSLITTAALALVVGGLSGSAVLAMLTLVVALGAHVYLRRTR
jgi:hypothetical protein